MLLLELAARSTLDQDPTPTYSCTFTTGCDYFCPTKSCGILGGNCCWLLLTFKHAYLGETAARDVFLPLPPPYLQRRGQEVAMAVRAPWQCVPTRSTGRHPPHLWPARETDTVCARPGLHCQVSDKLA